jgi:hypothetical protein
VGTFAIWDTLLLLHKNKMRRELLQQLNKEHLICFKKVQSDDNYFFNFFAWLGEDEFVLDDKMYDIVKNEKSGDTLIFYCLHDTKETEINLVIHRWMKENFGRSNQQKEEKKSNWTKWLEWKYCFHNTKFYLELPFTWVLLRSAKEKLPFVFLGLFAPPPERC